jgi:hypothetical protein
METRYAVIIGINDYDNQPLNFCVNDSNSIKEITGKLYEAISKINVFRYSNCRY